MSEERGVVLYAINNEGIDYLALALECAKRVHRFWKLPVCLVTDQNDVKSPHFDYVVTVTKPESENQRNFPDYKRIMAFYNQDRCNVWKLSPFYETIVIDTDYVIQTDALPSLWTNQDFLIPRHAYSISDHQMPPSLLRVSPTSVPMYWATIVMFRRTMLAREFFHLWQDCQQNYHAFGQLLGFDPTLYRNDYGVTIAMYRLFGGLAPELFTLPFSIPTALPEVEVDGLDPLTFKDIGRVFSDVHVLNKKTLLETLCAKAS